MAQRWVARWLTQDNKPQAYIFTAPDNRMIARLDFRLKMIDMGVVAPQHFEVDEYSVILKAVQQARRGARVYA